VFVADPRKLLLLHLDGVEHLPDLGGRQDDSGVVLTRNAIAVAAHGANLT
jgi:hypothetical protein